MPVSLQQFVKHLADSGLMSDEEILDLQAGVPAEKLTPDDAQPFAKELVKQRKLTAFQATALYQGKPNGLVFGNYTVLDKLGQGGMGTVFKAEHRRMKRVVALKVMSAAGMKSPDAVKRFRREVEAAAKLTHPNIVAAFDADEAKGTHFLVMEYVEGDDLSQLVKKHGTLPVDRAIQYTIQAARGLEHAHNEGVVHRDIKPANLLLDKSGTVKILDMGLARIDEAVGGRADATGLTQTGNIMGTVDYMSPEQALNSKYADRRSDIYSLGCSLWFLLTGKSVYSGESLMQRLMAHQEQPIPSLSGSISLDKSAEDSAALDAVFAKMIAKKPDNRYQTMGEAISDLESLLAGRQVAASTSASWGAGNPLGLGGSGSSAISGEQDSALREFLQAIDPNAPGSGARSRTRPASETLASKAGEKTQVSILQSSLQQIAKLPPQARWSLAGGGGILIVALVALLWRGGGAPEAGNAPASPDTTAKRAKSPEASKNEKSVAAIAPAMDGQFVAASKPLFSNDLSGWRALSQYWKVANGALVGSSMTQSLNHNTFVCSPRKYRDFELEFQVRLKEGKGNSGVQIRSSILDEQKLIMSGPQVEIGPQFPGSLYGEKTGGWMKQGAANLDSVFRGDDFNDYFIRCAGSRLFVRLNGKVVLDDEIPGMPEDGLVGWQIHGGTPMEVAFKNVRLRELTGGGNSTLAAGGDWITLFNGQNMNGWRRMDPNKPGWQVKDGYMEIVPNASWIRTNDEYGPDYELHAEFWLPLVTDKTGQQRANSGIFLNGRHEIQILDMFNNPNVQPNQGCGGLYGAIAPKAGGILPAETWQTFDITYKSPKYDATGRVTTRGSLSVVHNGTKVIDNAPIDVAASTGASNTGGSETGPIVLQVHQTPGLRFRNLRLRPLGVAATRIAASTSAVKQTAGQPEPAALDFSPKGRVDVRSLPYDGSKPLTIEAWIKHGKLTEDGVIAHVGPFVLKYHVPLGRYELNAVDRTVKRSVIRATEYHQFIENRWFHIAGQWDGTTIELFVDGQPQLKLVANKELPKPSTAEVIRTAIRGWIDDMKDIYLSIGSNRPDLGERGQQYFSGQMAALRVSSVVRYTRQFNPAADVSMRLPRDNDTVALYLFNEGSGTRLGDSSGNNHHGQITGAIWKGGTTPLPAPAAPGWVDLFNGRDLSGWEQQGFNGWSVKSGVLVGETTGTNRGWLMTKGEYGDFEMALEYKISAGSNSGVFLRAPPQGDVSGSQFTEVQILDDDAPEFAKTGPGGKTGAVWNQIPAGPLAKAPVDSWNKMEILVRGKHVRVSVNGVVTAEGDPPRLSPTPGRIGLQLYPVRLEFRNIRVRNLSQAPVSAVSQSAPASRLLPLAPLNTPASDEGFCQVSPDGRTIYFNRETNTNQPGIYRATRSSPSAAFGPPAFVVAARHAVVSENELSLIALGGYSSQPTLLHEARRKSRNEAFSPLNPIPAFAGDPGVKSPWLSSDGLTLTYQRLDPKGDYPRKSGMTGARTEFVQSRRVSFEGTWSLPERVPFRDEPIITESMTWPMMACGSFSAMAARGRRKRCMPGDAALASRSAIPARSWSAPARCSAAPHDMWPRPGNCT